MWGTWIARVFDKQETKGEEIPIKEVPTTEDFKDYVDTGLIACRLIALTLDFRHVNWAIDYMKSDLPFVSCGDKASTPYIRLLNQAAIKYTKESGGD